MSRNLVIGAVAVILLILVGWFLTRPKQTVAPAIVEQTPVETEMASPASESAMMEEKNVINITSDGFSQKEITIKAGEAVTWMNTDSAVHTVNSAPHPTHTAYSPLNLGNIEPGGKVSLTFPTAGTFTYHDHLNPSLTGSVTVQ